MAGAARSWGDISEALPSWATLYFASGLLAAGLPDRILLLIVDSDAGPLADPVLPDSAFPGIPIMLVTPWPPPAFLAFANALNRGSHISVCRILLNAVGPARRYVMEIWCFSIGTAVAGICPITSTEVARISVKFNDVSQGQDARRSGSADADAGRRSHSGHRADRSPVTLLVTGNHRITARSSTESTRSRRYGRPISSSCSFSSCSCFWAPASGSAWP